MKTPLLVAVLFLVTLGVALWLLGAFPLEPAGPAAPEPTAPTATAPPAVEGGLEGAEPKEAPPPWVPEFAAPVRVVVLCETPRSFTQWLPMLWQLNPEIQWQMWFGETPPAGLETHVAALPPLAAAPAAGDLEGVRVLVLGGVDPARFPAEFWAAVAERVRDGRLGLLVLAEHRFAKAYADQPSLASVVPVADVKPVAPVAPGSTILHGVYDVPKGFVVTEAGRAHPAAKMVVFPRWSERIWAAQRAGAGAWTTKFCAAVGGPAPGATVLVELETGAGRAPALVASAPGKARVLWVGGFFDLENPAYTGTASYERARALAVAWIAWLAAIV
jgi:hypothetical protein